MKPVDVMKTFRVSALLFFAAAIVLAVGACGGKQSTDSTMTREERQEQKELEAQMTPEELEELRIEQLNERLDATLDEAVDIYLAADTTDDRDYKAIQKKLEEVLKERPEEGDIMFNIGVLRYEQGDLEGAEQWWQKATDSSDTYTGGMANIGVLRLQQGDIDGAKEIFNACVERSQTAPGCNINLALIKRNENIDDGSLTRAQAQPSIDHLRFALGGDGRNATAYADLARIYYELGQPALARQVAENAIQLGIDEAPLHNRLGLVSLADDDVIVAYKEFQRAVQLDPEFVDAWMNIGAMALSFRDYDAAHQAFEMVLKHRERLEKDNLVDAILSYGVAKRGRDDLDGAEALYKEVLELRNNDVRALYNLGVLHQEAHSDYKEAVKWFTEVVSAPGELDKELRADVEQRIRTLTELIEILGGDDGDDGFGDTEEPDDA